MSILAVDDEDEGDGLPYTEGDGVGEVDGGRV